MRDMPPATSSQQAQTLSYFDSVADEWRRKAEGKVDAAVNVVAHRNQCAIRVKRSLEISGGVKRFLDLGCGTGELTLQVAAESGASVEAIGVDFAPEMIAASEAKRREAGIANASFRCESILEFHDAPGSYDLISAMGLIEYLSPDQMQATVARCARWLRPGGALVVGSRNRLFNLFSLSDYTAMERELGVADALLAEAMAIASSPDMTSAIAAASQIRNELLPQPKSHPKTGIGVNVRHQYTPGELINLLRKTGLDTLTVFPIHYHALPVPVARAMPAVHVQISSAMHETAPLEHRLIPYASSFVIDARKA
jgi:2-polyprenyl-3-methyl-5-hydroxy-6-metoxy-1,4-benzoquinol methylase